MGIKAAFMVPHPPLIVPEVGRGGERQIKETSDAYDAVAKEIAKISPDTIIITSPHSVMYSDYFHISPGDCAYGDLRRFGAPQISFDEDYDLELSSAIADILSGEDFPGGFEGERDSNLDHGTMVPLYFIRKHYNKGKIIRIGLAGLPLADHYRLGMYIREATEKLGRSAVFVASGDLSHVLKESGPYGFDPAGPVYDEKIMDCAKRADFGEMLEFDQELLDKSSECGHRSFVIMAGALDGDTVRPHVYSHQDVTGVGYGIASFYPEGRSDERCFLAHRKVKGSSDGYVMLAKASIDSYVKNRKKLKVPEDIPSDVMAALPEEAFNRRAGAFVSIHETGDLRGCIGTIAPTKDSIAQEIVDNAISASTRDPRFAPVRKDELDLLEINVDILGDPEDIQGPEELNVKRYGVIVTSGYRRGLLLPDLEGVDDVATQVDIAMRKGGISPSDDYSLQRFEVIRHK